jgi:hypothetical protein
MIKHQTCHKRLNHLCPLLPVEMQYNNTLNELTKYSVSLIINYYFIAFQNETIDKIIIAQVYNDNDDD